MAEEKQIEKSIEYPLWLTKLQSKSLKFDEVVMPKIFLVSFLVFMIFFILSYYLLSLSSQLENLKQFLFPVGSLLLLFFIYIFWKIFAKESKLDQLELFSLYCGLVGVDLKKISLDKKIYTKIKVRLNRLDVQSRLISRSLKQMNQKTLRTSVVKLNENLKRLNRLLKEPQNYTKELEILSTRFIDLGSYVHNNQKMDNTYLTPIINDLQNIPEIKMKDKIEDTIRKIFEKIPTTLFLISIMAIGIILACVFPTDNILVRLAILTIIFAPAFGTFLLLVVNRFSS